MSNDIVSAARALVATPSEDAYVVLELAVLRHELAEARRELVIAQYAALDEHERADLAEVTVCTQAEALDAARSQLSLYEQLLREKDTRIDDLEHEVAGLDLLHESAVAMRDRLQAERDELDAECRKRGQAVAELEAECRQRDQRITELAAEVVQVKGALATEKGRADALQGRLAESARPVEAPPAAGEQCPHCQGVGFRSMRQHINYCPANPERKPPANRYARAKLAEQAAAPESEPEPEPARKTVARRVAELEPDRPFVCPQCGSDAFTRSPSSDLCMRCARVVKVAAVAA